MKLGKAGEVITLYEAFTTELDTILDDAIKEETRNPSLTPPPDRYDRVGQQIIEAPLAVKSPIASGRGALSSHTAHLGVHGLYVVFQAEEIHASDDRFVIASVGAGWRHSGPAGGELLIMNQSLGIRDISGSVTDRTRGMLRLLEQSLESAGLR